MCTLYEKEMGIPLADLGVHYVGTHAMPFRMAIERHQLKRSFWATLTLFIVLPILPRYEKRETYT